MDFTELHNNITYSSTRIILNDKCSLVVKHSTYWEQLLGGGKLNDYVHLIISHCG